MIFGLVFTPQVATSSFPLLLQRQDTTASSLERKLVVPPVEDKQIAYYQIPDEYISVPAIYKVGAFPSECATRGNKLYVGDKIAFLGPSEQVPYWIAEVKEIRTKTLTFVWYENDERGRFKKISWTETKPHMWCVYLHWRFKLNGDGTVPISAIDAIRHHELAYPGIEDGIYYRMRKPREQKAEEKQPAKTSRKGKKKRKRT